MRKNPACLACQSQKTGRLFKKHRRDYWRCQNCGFQFVSPFPGLAVTRKYYQKGFWKQSSHRGRKVVGYIGYRRERESFLAYFDSVLKRTKKRYPKLSGRVLDIGCGPGLFLKVARRAGFGVYGLDLSAEAVKAARKELRTKNIFERPIEKAGLGADVFDLVTSFQTVEHVSKPEQFLQEIMKAVKPGGVVLLATPDADGWLAGLMGENWFSYRHPDHLLFFNFESLSRLLKKTGFVRVKRLKDPPRWYRLDYLLEISAYYHRNKVLYNSIKLLRKMTGPLGKIKAPLPLGSLLVTAEKR